MIKKAPNIIGLSLKSSYTSVPFLLTSFYFLLEYDSDLIRPRPLPGIDLDGLLIPAIGFIVLFGFALRYRYKEIYPINNKYINISYCRETEMLDGVLVNFIYIYDINPYNNTILHSIFRWNLIPYVIRHEATRATFYNYEEPFKYEVVSSNPLIVALGFPNSLSHNRGRVIDDGSELLWNYVPKTRRLKTVRYDGFNIRNYITFISILLPMGGGVWVEGPTNVALAFYKARGYILCSGGKPLLTRISKTGKVEIFIRDDG
jgi:hypothetical protein